MNRSISLFLGFLLLSSQIPSANAARFQDGLNSPYELSLDRLAEQGVITGYTDGSIRPQMTISRAEAIVAITRAKAELKRDADWFAAHPAPLPLFSDTDTYGWYTPSIEAAFKYRLLTGYPDGTLRPNESIQVSEALTLITRAFGQAYGPFPIEASGFIENKSGQWYSTAVESAIRQNLIMKVAYLRADQPVTRGQFFDMLYRASDIHDRKIAVYDGPEPVVIAQQGSTTQSTENPFDFVSAKNFGISIPALGIRDLSIEHPQDASTQKGLLEPLSRGVGHLFNYPGQGGKVMIYAHSSDFPWNDPTYAQIFSTINKLKNGDRVYVTYENKLHIYEINGSKVVSPKDMAPFQSDGSGEQLILYTCWPPRSIAQRLLKFASPVQTIAMN